ncbi:MAG: c-type cytochrome [Nitrospinaceae bacterium]|nr:cytochrome c [Nitrospinaceae bacterium]NIR54512.1 cytochrome c [Nitrospinaceae bacterium]NIS84931.1 cytochrome c [Nitrospinaceae bacterium]NIT81745.1 cytochrome c [Nitrospinaceae bacterium]NIU44014.1 cytochrome c [Nitrospinaceae bacterium]
MSISRNLFLFFSGLWLIGGTAVPETRQAGEVPPSDPTLLAMHQGRAHGGRHERHQLHHGMGRGGKGVCPQTRATPQAPDKIAQLKNPLKLTRENYIKGESLYQWTAEPNPCKICHGPAGNGLGMMAQGLGGMPRNFTCAQTMKEVSDGQMFWIIRNGSPATGMPAYKFLSEDEIWKLILYIRQFEKK